MLDYIVRGGLIHDGSGGAEYNGDIAVADGRIVAVGGSIREAAKEVIDADGAVVTPAWIDLHTHYDGQATWDEAMEPSASHGVGTVVMGNCGVGFAPVLPQGEADLIDLMEGVEDIPGTALHEAMPWGQWESYPEYLDYLAKRRYAIDVSSMITHGAVRNYVMGGPDRANAAANDEEIQRMAQIVEEAMRAGAVGFSTSRVSGHRSIHGQSVPGTFAGDPEVAAIAAAMGRAGSGVFQAIPAGSFTWNHDNATIQDEVDLLCRLSAMSGRKATFSLVQKLDLPDEWKDVVAVAKAGNSRGAQVYPQVASRPGGFILSLDTYHVFTAKPSYIALRDLPLAARAAEMRKPEVKARILSETDVKAEFPGKMVSLIPTIPFEMEQTFPLQSDSDYEPAPEESFAAMARRGGGQDAVAYMYDHLVQGDGKNFVTSFIANYGHFNGDALREMQTDESTVVGLSDAGAHVCAVLDAVTPTYQLIFWARDRRRGPKLPLAHVVARQTKRNADLYGFSDRGLLAPGMRADLNVIDFGNLRLGELEVRRDLPAGGARLMQGAHGYLASMVKGELTRRMDQDTGARPGRLLRGKAG
jgi:N-acyl-D-aspartate/D-glutamate deacylase